MVIVFTEPQKPNNNNLHSLFIPQVKVSSSAKFLPQTLLHTQLAFYLVYVDSCVKFIFPQALATVKITPFATLSLASAPARPASRAKTAARCARGAFLAAAAPNAAAAATAPSATTKTADAPAVLAGKETSANDPAPQGCTAPLAQSAATASTEVFATLSTARATALLAMWALSANPSATLAPLAGKLNGYYLLVLILMKTVL